VTAAVINLCFHGVGEPGRPLEPGEEDYWIGADLLHGVLDEVADDPRVRISFDDGNSSDIELGLPALEERGLRATFYVLAGRLDQPGSLSRAEVRHLRDAGMEIGTHGMDHRPWRGLDRAASQRELVDARHRLEDTLGSGRIRHAALPLGRYDRRLLRQLRGLDYESVQTSDRRWCSADAWLQPRFSLRSGDTVQTVRRDVLSRAPIHHRVRSQVVGLVKRLR
jgi:peptidoglycan/xylan/chitin deacetylase (PgdA/CDA1 family)